jgi:starvation-inducible DNA-binding protein
MGPNHNDGNNLQRLILIQPNIGLDSDVRHSVVELLNLVLADEVVLTTKTRCAHWNAHGRDFYTLHNLFENHYQLLNNITNEIAERTRMLGGFAIGSLSDFIRYTRLEDQINDIPDVLHLLADHETAIRFLREDARKVTEEYQDDGTFELLVRVMRLHEKIAWMLRSYLEAGSSRE